MGGYGNMRIRVYDIDYCIEDEDVFDNFGDLNNEDEIEKAIKEIRDSLPQEIYIEDGFEDFDEDDFENIEDFIADKISDKTGWLVNTYRYKIMED